MTETRKISDRQAAFFAAARAGDIQTIQALLNQGVPVNLPDREERSRTALFVACAQGHLPLVQLLLNAGADANWQDENGITPLFVAHTLSVAQALVEHGADVNHTDFEGATALFRTRSADMAGFLLECGCDVSHETLDGQTPLCLADNEELAALFLAHGADANHSDREGLTPIFAANTVEHALLLVEHGAYIHHRDKHGDCTFAITSSLALTKYFLDLGCDVDTRDALKQTLLMRAAEESRMETVRLLLAHGASTSVCNTLGETLMHVVYDPDMADFLYQQGAPLDLPDRTGKTPLQVALNKGYTDLARFFLEHGAKTDSLSTTQIWDDEALALLARAQGNTGLLLLCAVKTDNVEQAREFLEQGADIHVRDREGNTLLHLAVSGKMVRLLLDLGADLYAENNFGQNPLFLAIWESRAEVIPALLEGGIDANAPDSDGYTPLLAARDPAVAALLIRHGADVNARSKSGKTPLMDTSKDLDVLCVLAQAGVMLTARDDEGNTALHMAWDADVLPYLVHSGADINALNNKGESPLMSAARGTGDRLGTLLTLGANPSLRDKRVSHIG